MPEQLTGLFGVVKERFCRIMELCSIRGPLGRVLELSCPFFGRRISPSAEGDQGALPPAPAIF